MRGGGGSGKVFYAGAGRIRAGIWLYIAIPCEVLFSQGLVFRLFPPLLLFTMEKAGHSVDPRALLGCPCVPQVLSAVLCSMEVFIMLRNKFWTPVGLLNGASRPL